MAADKLDARTVERLTVAESERLDWLLHDLNQLGVWLRTVDASPRALLEAAEILYVSFAENRSSHHRS